MQTKLVLGRIDKQYNPPVTPPAKPRIIKRNISDTGKLDQVLLTLKCSTHYYTVGTSSNTIHTTITMSEQEELRSQAEGRSGITTADAVTVKNREQSLTLIYI